MTHRAFDTLFVSWPSPSMGSGWRPPIRKSFSCGICKIVRLGQDDLESRVVVP